MYRIARLTIVLFAFFILAEPHLYGQDTATVKIGVIKATENADTLRVPFKIVQKGVKKHISGAKPGVKVLERAGSMQIQHETDRVFLEDLREGVVPEDLTIMILGDRSVGGNLLETTQYEAVKELVTVFEGSNVYLSFIDGDRVTESRSVNRKTDADKATFDSQFSRLMCDGSGDKDLYGAILTKLNELETRFGNGTNLLFVFTDGQTSINVQKYLELSEKQQQGKVPPIFSVYVGAEGSLDADLYNDLYALSYTESNNEINGKLYTKMTADSVRSIVVSAKDSIADDYCLVIVNEAGRRYSGEDIVLSIELESDGLHASGSKNYHLGSVDHNIVVHDNASSRLLKGIVAGLLVLALAYLVIQLLIPFIRYKIFLKKYVKQFSTNNSDIVSQECYFCKEKFEEGDLVVAKCEHLVHKECWEENRDRCPEYGVHKCTKGIHYYNRKQLFDTKNATHFAPWIIYGLAGGLLAWSLFNMIYSPGIFSGMVEGLALWLYPMPDGLSEADQALYMYDLGGFVPKVQSWLLEGILLGFFIPLTFSFILEFRKKNMKILGFMLLKALVGAIGGFLAFTLGSIVIIAANKSASCWYLDWIPWLLFALATALVMWYKTEIDLKSALIGGGISVLFSFLFLIATNGLYSSLLCYMLYAAGFGVAIAVVHFASEKYFLRIDGSIKERDIAIYKWMSVTGGFNKVSIGSSIDSVLQMNWDDTPGIGARVVELYLENDRPYCRVLDKGVSQQGRTIPKGTVMLLVHGSEFSIGKTRFTYIEKDK